MTEVFTAARSERTQACATARPPNGSAFYFSLRILNRAATRSHLTQRQCGRP